MKVSGMKNTLKALFLGCGLLLSLPQDVTAHSVAQVQTTKYFHPDTVQMLVDRALAGNPGFQVGDTVSYIIEFTPVPNGSNLGVQGYVTDYIPDGVEVVGAAIVQKDAGGNFIAIPPDLPGMSYDGWGARGQATFNAPFNVNTYTAGCAAYTNNCNGRMCELQADTGIFYSTDPRTAQFPLLPTRILQGTAGNGYTINPVRSAQLNPIIGQTVATTHNLWDADQTNGFGSTAAAIAALAAPKSAQTALIATRMGDTPFNAGSPVAGPQTGYQLDNTGAVGPWQRIAYAGSRMGDLSRGPATATGVGAVCGFSTSTGWNLSTSNPLPSGTNAVRWALGKLQVGQIKYVRIDLRLTAPVPAAGLINASEVFGADTTTDDPSTTILTGDNAWMYHIPSVADNNANLLVLKTVIGYYSGATLIPSDGSSIPANAKVRYRTVYLNSGNANQTNVTLTDTLPCQTAANPVSNITVVSGSIGVGMANPVVAAGTVATNCTAAGRRTFSFTPTIATLGPGLGGTLEYDVQLAGMAANTLYNVPNTVKLVSDAIPAGVTSSANATVMSTTSPNLTITKTTSTPSVASGGTVTYTLTVTNNGTAAASNINVYDFLPTTGGVNDALTRFNYAAAGSTAGMTAVTPTQSVPPTLTPYSTGGVSANQQQVLWNFGAQTLAVGASMSITYTATVGTNVPATATPYYSSAAVTYTGGVARDDTVSTAPVTVSSTLSASASITHYFNTGTGTWVPYSSFIPANAKVRYQVDYSNTGGSPVTGANITSLLPCQTGANAVSNVVITSGPVLAPAPNPPVTAAGNCATGTRQSFSFTAGTLAAGQSGSLTFDVQTNAAAGNNVVETVTLSGAGVASAVDEVQTTVQSTPLLNISKSISASSAKQGATVSYTLTVTNTGTANASNMLVYDWLPSGGAAANPLTRLSSVAGSSVFGGSITAVVPTLRMPPAATPFNTNVNAANMEELAWDFGAQTLAPGASFTITYNATIGSSVPLGVYGNYARAYSANTNLTGTVSVTNNNATVTGTGTLFLSQLTAGSVITIAGANYVVSAIASNTSLTLTRVYAGATAAGLAVTKKSAQTNSNVSSLEVATAIADVTVSSLSNGVATLNAGSSTVYTITLTNNGPDAATGIKVLDPAAAGLSKTGVSCSSAGGASCPFFSTVGALESGGLSVDLPVGGQITLTVNADVTATGGTVTNSATVLLPSGVTDSNWSNNSLSDTDTIIASRLSTSTKGWTDANGGEQDPGDVITYTITLIETGGVAATNISVTDDIPAGLTNFTVTAKPAGSSDNSTPAGGANGTGYLDISNITVPANSSVTVVFTANIGATETPGTQIANCASVTNPTGVGAAPCAATITVSPSALVVPSTGLKPLYLHDSLSVPAFKLSRTAMATSAATNINIAGLGGTQTWTLSPVLQSAVTLDPTISATIPVSLYLATGSNRTYSVPVTLLCGATTVATLTSNAALTATPALFTFNLPLAAAVTCPAGSSWALKVDNPSTRTTRNILVYPAPAAGQTSSVTLPSQNVINVDSVNEYSAAYPAVTTVASFARGGTAYVRAVVSDPFGSFDITSATLTLTDPTGAVVANNVAMTAVADSGAATKTFEYAHAIPLASTIGTWTYTVTAKEGTENTVTHAKDGAFSTIAAPVLSTSTKGWTDANGGDALPGETITYTITINETAGFNATGVRVTDDIPANVTGFTVTGLPAGATDNSTSGGGANGTGYLDVSGIAVPANGSVTVTFTVAIGAAVASGTTIDNCAAVTIPVGAGAAPCAATLTVAASSVPTTGMKPLYLYDAAGTFKLSRTPMATNAASFITLAENGGTQTWTLSPVLQSPVTIDSAVSATIPVTLYLDTGRSRTYSIPITLMCGATTVATLTGSAALTAGTVTPFTFNLPLAATATCPLGSSWALKIDNPPVNSGGGTRTILVYPAPAAGQTSSVTLPSQNVINVDSATAYTAAYPAVTTAASVAAGSTIYLRAVVSDPFGSFDITSATVGVTDSGGTPILTPGGLLTGTLAATNGSPTITGTGTSFTTALVAGDVLAMPGGCFTVLSIASNTSLTLSTNYTGTTASGMQAGTKAAGYMCQVADSGAATKTFEYAYAIPAAATAGGWTFNVTAHEGSENTVSHTGSGGFQIQPPVDHYEISVSGTSITCLPTTVTVKACADSSNPCTTLANGINGGVTVSTDAGTLSSATVTLTNGVGTTTLSYPLASEGATATVSLTSGIYTSTYACAGGASGCTTTFNKAGFIVVDSDVAADCGGGACAEAVVLSQVAGQSDGSTYYLKAVKASDKTPQNCAAALTNTTTDVGFAYECNDPDTCSGSDLMSVNGGTATTVARNDGGSVASYTPVSMAFNANGNAPFTFVFSDVGMVRLHMSKTLTATAANTDAVLTGSSNPFVTAPHHFDVTAKCTTADAANCGAGALPTGANPAAANAAGTAFIMAGTPFTVTVAAKNAAGNTTPNFGLEATPETVTLQPVSNADPCPAGNSCLVAPAGGVEGTLDGGVFATTSTKDMLGNWDVRTGAVESTTATWDEVGILQLRVANTDYLGSGLPAYSVATSATDVAYDSALNVGRFTPHHFTVSVPGDATGPMPCPAAPTVCVDTVASPGVVPPGSFDGVVYSGQPFSVQVIARSLGGGMTQNYQGAFAKEVTLSAWAAPGSATGNPGAGTVGNPTAAAGDFTSGIALVATPKYTFQSALTAPQNIFMRAMEASGDGITSLRAVASDSLEGGVRVASGRIWFMGNPYGSELLPLTVTVQLQYYDGAKWVNSTMDDITPFSTALTTAGGHLSPTYRTGPLAAIVVRNPLLGSVTNGRRTFTLDKPGVTGVVDLALTSPSYLLAGSNTNAVDPSNFARVTFGIYQGNDAIIYLREAY
jgi:MSHA biogenesis protein MshQ